MAVKSLTHNPFWDFSVSLYANPPVAEACLMLQDDWDADVNLILYGIWLAYYGQTWQLDEVTSLQGQFDSWRAATLLPIRAVRKRLAYQGKRRYYHFLKNLELRAEKHQQDQLWLSWMRRHDEPIVSVDRRRFAETLAHNLAIYIQRLEMKPRSRVMRPAVDDQITVLMEAVIEHIPQ